MQTEPDFGRPVAPNSTRGGQSVASSGEELATFLRWAIASTLPMCSGLRLERSASSWSLTRSARQAEHAVT